MYRNYHPRSCMIFLMVMFLLALLYQNHVTLLAMLVGLALLNLALDRARAWLRMLGYALPFALLILIINVIVNQQGPLWGEYNFQGLRLTIHTQALFYGTAMILRLLTVLSIFTVFNLVLSVEEIMEVFSSRQGTAIITAVITARMMPELGRRVQGMREIQMVRCVDPKGGGLLERCRRAGMLVINILRAALNGAWKTGEAMQARGFGAVPLRTTYRQHRWRRMDNWLVLASLSALLLAVFFDWWRAGTQYSTILGGVVPLVLLGSVGLLIPLFNKCNLNMQRSQTID